MFIYTPEQKIRQEYILCLFKDVSYRFNSYQPYLGVFSQNIPNATQRWQDVRSYNLGGMGCSANVPWQPGQPAVDLSGVCFVCFGRFQTSQ